MNTGVFEQAAAVRQRRRIPLQAIADSTKIGVPYLRAIEEQHFDRLPGGIYSVSYIRQYARAVDFDEDELLSAYYSLTGAVQMGGEAAENAGRAMRPFERVRGFAERLPEMIHLLLSRPAK